MCTTRLGAVQKTGGKAWYSEASAPAGSRRRLHRRLLLRGKGGASSLRADPEPVRPSKTQCSRREGANCLREWSNERGKWAGRSDQRAEWAARVVSEPLAHRQNGSTPKAVTTIESARMVYDFTWDAAQGAT